MTVAEKQKDVLSLFMKSGRRHFHFSLLLISAEKWKDVLLPYAWKSLEFPSVRRFPLPSVGHRSPSPAREGRSLFWWNWWNLHDIVFYRIIFSFSFYFGTKPTLGVARFLDLVSGQNYHVLGKHFAWQELLWLERYFTLPEILGDGDILSLEIFGIV